MMSRLAKARWSLVAVTVGLPFAPWTSAQNLTNNQLQPVVARLADGSMHSWELGTRAQALLELGHPLFSVFSTTPLPPPLTAPSSSASANLTDVTSIARNTVSTLRTSTAPQPLVANDNSTGGPASIGVAVLLASWTDAPPPVAPVVNVKRDNAARTTSPRVAYSISPTNTASTNGTIPSYAEAATSQLEFLLTSVPRTGDGAISNTVPQVQLWSDFIYGVPPFLAYYGVLTGNKSLVDQSYDQIKLYRNYLRDPDAHNLWRHIALGSGTDSGHWSTGNGWAAYGMLRVLATIKHSSFASQLQSEQTDLTNWVVEILDGMYNHSTPSNIFHNYADDTSTFDDCSSTALIAAATYRLAVLTNIYHNLPNAELGRTTISDGSHFDSNGWLTPVVDSVNWTLNGSQSPLGQAFVVDMQAAWLDWVAIGSPGANSAPKFGVIWSAVIVGVVLVFLVT